jgi:hypothetical protein
VYDFIIIFLFSLHFNGGTQMDVKYAWLTHGKKIYHNGNYFFNFFPPFTEVGSPYGEYLQELWQVFARHLIPVQQFEKFVPPVVTDTIPVQIRDSSKFTDVLTEMQNRSWIPFYGQSNNRNSPHDSVYREGIHATWTDEPWDALNPLSLFAKVIFDTQGRLLKFEWKGRHSASSPIFLQKIVDLPNNAPELESLGLGYDFMEELPTSFTEFHHLKIAAIGSFRLRAISSDFFPALPTLEQFSLLRSALQTLPASIGYAPALQMVMLAESPHLSELPPELGYCEQLEYLTIYPTTNIRSIPAELRHCPLQRPRSSEFAAGTIHDTMEIPLDLRPIFPCSDLRFHLSSQPDISLREWYALRLAMGWEDEIASAEEFIEEYWQRPNKWPFRIPLALDKDRMEEEGPEYYKNIELQYPLDPPLRRIDDITNDIGIVL